MQLRVWALKADLTCMPGLTCGVESLGVVGILLTEVEEEVEKEEVEGVAEEGGEGRHSSTGHRPLFSSARKAFGRELRMNFSTTKYLFSGFRIQIRIGSVFTELLNTHPGVQTRG